MAKYKLNLVRVQEVRWVEVGSESEDIRLASRWEDNIRMDRREIGCEVDWINLDQDRDQRQDPVSTVMKH
jgi:hypothetical protein